METTSSPAPAILLPPLPAAQWGEEVDSALRGMLPRARRNPEAAGNGLATMVHHPDLTKAFLALNVHLLFNSPLPARLREVAILRVTQHCRAPYEWHHHVTMGKMVGLTDADIAGIQAGSAPDPVDQLIVDAVDELEDTARLSESTWTALGEHLDDRQRMDLIFTTGTYRTLATAFNTFGVQLDSPADPQQSTPQQPTPEHREDR